MGKVEAKPVARPKRGAKRKPIPEGVDPEDVRVAIVSLKGSPELHAFVEAVSKAEQLPIAACYRLAFRAWCEAKGHGTPPSV